MKQKMGAERKAEPNARSLYSTRKVIQQCLVNAEQLLSSAKEIQEKGRNHIAFHLAALAMEEIGKASMIFATAFRPRFASQDEDDDEDTEVSNKFEDHKHKLFWAMIIPSMGSGVITPEQFTELKEIARDVHVSRLASLYVNPEQTVNQEEISDEKLEKLIRLTESRLSLEKVMKYEDLEASEQEMLNWFLSRMDDPTMRGYLLSEQSRGKLAKTI